MKKRIISLAILLAVVCSMALCAVLQGQQQSLSRKIIRLHVVANSDSAADQSIKLQVRDAVLRAAAQILETAADPLAEMEAGLPKIEQAASARLQALGLTVPVKVSLRKELFPTRTYREFSLPAGAYQSLRVTIGSGGGHNWWCVIFPSLCMSASMDELEKAAQAAGFSRGEISLITESSDGFVLKFKSLELLQKLKNALLGS